MPDSGTFIWSFHERSWWNQPVPVETLNQGSLASESEVSHSTPLGVFFSASSTTFQSGLKQTISSTPSSIARRASFFNSSSGWYMMTSMPEIICVTRCAGMFGNSFCAKSRKKT